MRSAAPFPVLMVACSLAGCGAWAKLFPDDGADVDAGTVATPITKGDAAVTPIAVADAAVAISAPGVSLFDPPALNPTVEAPLIKAVASTLASALTASDLATASAQFTTETRAAYLKLAAALLQLDVTTLVRAAVKREDLRAEAQVVLDGRTFHVGWVKTGNPWLIETL